MTERHRYCDDCNVEIDPEWAEDGGCTVCRLCWTEYADEDYVPDPIHAQAIRDALLERHTRKTREA